jgi:Zn-dependent protease with chaperone function
MKFVGKLPKDGINVSETHPLVEAGALLVGLTAIFALIAIVLIFLVEIALYFVTVEQEAKLFDGWLPDDLVMVTHNDDRLKATQALVDRLVDHWPDSQYLYRIEIDDSEVANAMAFPGGLIIVTQGLLDQVESENELAFVLGHELGHFKNRDHLRGLGRGILLSLFFSVTTGSDVAGIGINAADIALRGFSRQQESNADEFGLSVVNAEYGHVNESWRLFERWDAREKGLIDLAPYLSTHPDSGDRVANMQKYAYDLGWLLDGETSLLDW